MPLPVALPLLLLLAAPPQIAPWFKGSVLIASHGEIILHQGYGFDAETPFWIASISKQFTAAAIIKLRDRGKLALSDPITKFVGPVPPDKRAITIAQLLTHTAGLENNYAADGIDDRKKAIAALLSPSLLRPPGGAFGYTNDAYNLLAIIVELASGQRFEAFVQREILDPAHLEHTGFWKGAGHERVAPILNKPEVQKVDPSYGFRGATGMYSTTGDLYRWYLALVADPKLAKELQSPQVAISDGRAGYGWYLTPSPSPRRTKSVWTRGTEDFGHNAILMSFPEEQLVIVAASNAGDRDGIAASRKLAEDLGASMLAADFAAKLANDECDRKYGVRPFAADQWQIETRDGRWIWGRVDGASASGYSATVSFERDGARPEVRIYRNADDGVGRRSDIFDPED